MAEHDQDIVPSIGLMPDHIPEFDDGQEMRKLAAFPTPRLMASSVPDFGEAFAEAPDSELFEIDNLLDGWDFPVWDQGRRGSCNGQSWALAFTLAWKLSGQSYYEFSPTSVYARMNGNQDNGSVIADGGAVLRRFGASLMHQFGQDKIYLNQMSAVAKKTAERFRARSIFRITNYRQLLTAICKRMAVCSGIGIGKNFSAIDANGVCPLPDTVIGGHALAYVGIKKIDGVWMPKVRNSWGLWALNGHAFLQPDAWDPKFGFPFDAYVITGVEDDPQSTREDPPVATS